MASTYSESWYRVADAKVALRPHVYIRRQFFRGERYYVLHDPLNNQFFRLRPPAYEFIARLSLDRTVESAWHECVEAHPADAPGQEDAIRLLSQLFAANLLYSDLPPDSLAIYERQSKQKRREIGSKLLNILFARFPIWDPDSFLKRIMPLARLVISPWGMIVWLLTVGAALKVVIDNAHVLASHSEGALAPGNLPWLYTALLLSKGLHEMGHAVSCRRFGGEVHVLGIMLMFLTPMPYVDTTSSWSFRNRWHRIFVASAGMIAELFFASIAAFVWVSTADGPLHSVAWNVMLVASVSTVLFNINPLLRFDGYYILSDLLDIPNLQIRANRQLTMLAEKHLFGVKNARPPATTRSEAFWLVTYSVASTIYRSILFFAIALVIAGEYLILGLIMAAGCVVSWMVMPIVKLVKYLATSQRVSRTRPRAIAVSAGIATATALLLGAVPVRNGFRAPGVIEAEQHRAISVIAPGRLGEIAARSGEKVSRGQVLVRMEDPKLDWELLGARAEMAEAQAMRTRAMEESIADLEPLDARVAAVRKRLQRLEEMEKELIISAPHDGMWIAPELDHLAGAWLPRGIELGQVIDSSTFHFTAVVPQHEASRLFAGQIRSIQIRLFGEASKPLPAHFERIIPADQVVLPSAALGWKGGGEVALAQNDGNGLRAREPFFAIHARLDPVADPAALAHGRSGRIRFELPPEPLFPQFLRSLRQTLQSRYGI